MRQVGWLILAAICTVVASCSSDTAAPAVAPVGEVELAAYLLNPSEVDAAMGTTGMTVAGRYVKMDDHSAAVSEKNCLVMYGPGEPSVYADSGVAATRAQFLKDAEASSKIKHAAFQTVVSFQSAEKATEFYAASAERWSACADRRYTITLPESKMTWAVGPVSNTEGTLSATETREGGQPWVCQRALTVRNNVAVDITACSSKPANAAVDIAHKIADKLPK